MKRLLLVVAGGLTVVALAGAVGLPDLAGAQDAPEATDSITVSGVGTVNAVPDEAQMSFGVETRGATARAAVSANADAAAQGDQRPPPGGRTRDRHPVRERLSRLTARPDRHRILGVQLRVGRHRRRRRSGAVDAAVGAGANSISGPGMSSSNAEVLYRQALGKAVDEARARAQVLAKAAGRSLGAITSIVESSAEPPMPYYAERAALDSATPIVPGQQETTATISVTFSLR